MSIEFQFIWGFLIGAGVGALIALIVAHKIVKRVIKKVLYEHMRGGLHQRNENLKNFDWPMACTINRLRLLYSEHNELCLYYN